MQSLTACPLSALWVLSGGLTPVTVSANGAKSDVDENIALF